MLFAVICKDKAGEGLARRIAARPAHLEFLAGLGDKLRCAGPMLSPDAAQPIGSLLIIEAETMDAAQAIAAADPYAHADVFESVEIVPWRQAVGAVTL